MRSYLVDLPDKRPDPQTCKTPTTDGTQQHLFVPKYTVFFYFIFIFTKYSAFIVNNCVSIPPQHTVDAMSQTQVQD